MTDRSAEWERLLRAANAGDARAYRHFLQAITPVLRGIVRARGPALGAQDAEDIVQEVLLAIHLKRHTWAPERPLAPWLYAITRHKVIDAFRARGSRVDLPIEALADTLPAAPAPDPTERHDALRMIDRLDPRSAEIVRAIGLEGAEIAETGRRLKMTEGAVRVSLHRALRRLAALRERHVE